MGDTVAVRARILGVTSLFVGSQALDLGPVRPRLVLAKLALSAGQVVGGAHRPTRPGSLARRATEFLGGAAPVRSHDDPQGGGGRRLPGASSAPQTVDTASISTRIASTSDASAPWSRPRRTY